MDSSVSEKVLFHIFVEIQVNMISHLFLFIPEGNRAVLGLPGPSGPHVLPNGVPIEHAVSTQTLRPGSGFLNVTVITDGPTRVIKIMDVKQQVVRSSHISSDLSGIRI